MITSYTAPATHRTILISLKWLESGNAFLECSFFIGNRMIYLHPFFFMPDLFKFILTIIPGKPSPSSANGFRLNDITAFQKCRVKYHNAEIFIDLLKCKISMLVNRFVYTNQLSI